MGGGLCVGGSVFVCSAERVLNHRRPALGLTNRKIGFDESHAGPR